MTVKEEIEKEETVERPLDSALLSSTNMQSYRTLCFWLKQ